LREIHSFDLKKYSQIKNETVFSLFSFSEAVFNQNLLYMLQLEILQNKVKDEQSNKPPILFLHGMWHGAWCWESYFLPYFGKLGYKSYAMSLSNHAGSPRKKAFNLLRIKDYVKDLEDVINSLEETPILVGHSMGGYIVQKYLENNKVPGAVLLAPVPPFGIWAGTLNVLKNFPFAFLKANLTLNLKTIINHPKRFRHILCSDNIKEEEITKYLPKIDTESILAYIDMLGLNLVKTKKINSPLLIIGGGKDNAVPLKVLHKTADKYAVSPKIFKEMGHNIMLEPDYKKVVDLIDNWIQYNYKK